MDPRTWDLMKSSKSGDHETPWDFYEQLNREFYFDLDVCASWQNTKHPTFYGYQKNGDFTDGLKEPWGHENADVVAYANPPYGKGIRDWLAKAIHERDNNNVTSVFLLPVRSDTSWYHEFVLAEASEIRFIRGRLKFEGTESSAPFPSMIVIYYPKPKPKSESEEQRYQWGIVNPGA